MFSGGVDKQHWAVMGEANLTLNLNLCVRITPDKHTYVCVSEGKKC